MKNIDLSVVVTTKNESRLLPNLLKSLKLQTKKSFEVIVVDNYSSDDTVLIAKKYGARVFSRGPERSEQRNFGVEKSLSKYVLILDADMELSKNVVKDLLETVKRDDYKAITIPEKTIGKSFISKVRRFEREMYEGDSTIEVPRFFEKKIFKEFGGYDVDLTGPEDYDLPYRISKKYKMGRSKAYLYHNEDKLTLSKLLRKKYYYANQGALYARKHPELIKTQGNFLFRNAYFRNWRNFLKHPILACSFIFVKILEMVWAILGYIKAVGMLGFVQTLLKLIK